MFSGAHIQQIEIFLVQDDSAENGAKRAEYGAEGVVVESGGEPSYEELAVVGEFLAGPLGTLWHAEAGAWPMHAACMANNYDLS
jgi:hypothetical protein